MTIVRPEEPEDAPDVRRVNELAFGTPAEANLVEALRSRDKAVLSLVAVDNARIVGHILFSSVMIGSSDERLRALGLGPMAVLPEHQRMGIGSMMVGTGLDQCKSAGYDCVVVVGHAEYYPRFGFVPASRFGLRCEYAVPDDVFMALELRPGALSERSGLVKYQPEFDEV